MKKLILSLSFVSLLNLPSTFAQGEALGHGGGNGGDDFELELKKRSLQIGSFVKSTVGSQVFNMINADSVIKTVNSMDIDIVSGNVTDKYGTLRTCVNEPERQLITCNLDRINELRKNKQDDILTGLLFHEILGLMGLELGHQDNVSMYPISSKIIPYYSVVATTPITESDIRPEYYGLDSRSYGITLVNRKTKESIRMICLNDNVEIHRCRNYTIVRNAKGLQAPLFPEIVSFHPSKISAKVEKTRNSYAEEVLNLANDLSIIGEKVSVKNEIYEEVIGAIKSYISQLEPRRYVCWLAEDCPRSGVELVYIDFEVTLATAYQLCQQINKHKYKLKLCEVEPQ